MKLEEIIYRLFLVWYACGVLLLGFDLLPAWLEWANAVFLVLAGILAAIYFLKAYGKKLGSVLILIIFMTTFLIEWLGSSYGILFGNYYYTKQFAPILFEVPIAIGFAWLMVMATSSVLANKIAGSNKFIKPLIGGIIAVIIDLIIDPVSFKIKGYWIWNEGGNYYDIPFSNFFGWFIVAFCLHIILCLFKRTSISGMTKSIWEQRMILLFILIIAMFVLLGLLGKLWLASIVTVLLSTIIVLLAIFRSKK